MNISVISGITRGGAGFEPSTQPWQVASSILSTLGGDHATRPNVGQRRRQSLRRVFLGPLFDAPQAQRPSQLGSQRVAVEKRFAGPAEQSSVLELLDVRQVTKALETKMRQEPRRRDIGIGSAGRWAARPGGDEAFAAQRGDRVAGNLPAQKLRQLPTSDRLKIPDRHQDERVRARQFGFLRGPERGPDRVAKAQFGPKTPTAGDGDDLIRTAAQFVANILDDEVEVAAAPDDARQVLAQDRLGGGEDRRLDAAHPFAPARRRRQVFELAVEVA